MKTDQAATRGPRMSGRILVLIIVVAAVIGAVLTVAAFYLNAASTGTTSMSGILYVSSTGQLDGPAGYAATYNATLASTDGRGNMNLTLINGTSDVLQLHEYQVTDLVASPYNLTLSLDGRNLTLPWVSNSTVWKQYNESYIASWGPSAPSTQLAGTISPQDFSGVPTGYYVALILTVPSQPADNIPFAIGTYARVEPAALPLCSLIS